MTAKLGCDSSKSAVDNQIMSKGKLPDWILFGNPKGGEIKSKNKQKNKAKEEVSYLLRLHFPWAPFLEKKVYSKLFLK